MYYYAIIDTTTGICTFVYESETEIISPDHIPLDELDTSLMFRKKYENGVWVDTTPEEAMQYNGMHVAIFGRWLDEVLNDKSEIDHTHTEYAASNHTHDSYVSSDDLALLEDVVDTKADASHTHDDYALASHTHSEYAETTHTHNNYAETAHTHDDYSLTTHSHTASEIGAASSDHNHNDDYADINHNHDSAYSTVGHNHDTIYSMVDHSHTNYATVTAFDTLEDTVSGKADISHTHTDYALVSHNHSEYSPASHDHDEDYAALSHSHIDYATTSALSELSTTVANKADSSHTHIGVYDESGAAASALSSANAYTDAKIDALVGEGASDTLNSIGEISSAIEDNQDAIDLLNAAIANKANVVDLNSHASDTELHITDAERNIWNAKSDFSGNYNDLTNKPNIPSIDGLATETYVDTQISAIDIPSALSDLTTDSAHRLVTDTEKATWNAKSNFSGSYNDLTDKPSIPSISGLATEAYVDEAVSTKANNNHNHNDVYYTETEVDSLLSAKSNSSHNHDSSYDALGTAEAKANAVQANLDVVSEDLAEHIDNADIHFTAAERTKLSGIAANANNYTHPNSGITAGTYKSVTVNAQGHITAGTNPTTLAGYGITDAESKGAANSALVSAKAYTDAEIDTLNEAVAIKANASDLSSHTGNTTAHITSTERTNWNAAKTHADSAHAPSNAEPNQNAFSNVVVGSTTISADSKTDTLTLVAGNNVTITPDSTGDSITISSANTVYTHPTTAGNKHIPAGGSSGQILRWASDGTAVWGNDNNTTYSNATQTSSGLMSDTDKTKLDGIAEITSTEIRTLFAN